MSDTTLPSAADAAMPATFADGVRDIIPVVVAALPFGIVFGALAVQEGMSTIEALFMSGAVYAGASQFVALEFWADPLPFWTILLSVLAVNLRHVLYSAALGRKMTHWPAWQRYLGFALLVDPTYALSDLRGGSRLSAAYYFGLGLPLYVGWLLFTFLGCVFGALVANPERIGLDFMVTAYFIFLIAGFRKRSNAGYVILASAAGSVATYLLFGAPWHFAGGAFAGMATAALLVQPEAPA